MESVEDFRRRIRDQSLDSSEVIDVYAAWAETYEETSCVGSRSPAGCRALLDVMSKVLKQQKDGKILDCGAGSGFYGDLLVKEGYGHVDAVDGSAKMLDKAKERGVYKRVFCSLIGSNKLDVETNTYDLIFCVGSLYENHIKDDCFPELLRITTPGGYIIFLVTQKYLSKKFEKTMQEFHDNKRWTWLDSVIVDDYSRIPKEDGSFEIHAGLMYVFRKPAASIAD